MHAASVRVETAIEIDRTPQSVFDYVTTPALWHTWHPATASVRDVPDRPLVEGETVVEIIAMAGRTDEALWTVVACEAPRRWEIETDTHKGSARIVYRIDATAKGCRFHRTLDFRSKGALWRLLDSTLTRLFLIRQSSRALRQLKQVLER
jgi:uncharacterized protein YndB with AHSA1/START domain